MANFGATFDPATSNITFRVFSAHATRVELWLYVQPTGNPENLRLEMTPSGDDPRVFVETVTKATLLGAGLVGVVYYGYRAWGPNWSFNPAWSPGSGVGFVTDCDADGETGSTQTSSSWIRMRLKAAMIL